MASSNVLLSGDGSGGLMPDWSHDRREDRLQAGRSESVVAESGFTWDDFFRRGSDFCLGGRP